MRLFSGKKKSQSEEEIPCAKALGEVEWVEFEGVKMSSEDFKNLNKKKENDARPKN